MRSHRVQQLFLALIVAFAGCGGSESSNLSPTSEQDPARHERAARDVQEKVRNDQEAERAAFRRQGKSLPPS